MSDSTDNPRLQCDKCGQWKRLHGVKDGTYYQYLYPVGIADNWCDKCIDNPENKEEYERL